MTIGAMIREEEHIRDAGVLMLLPPDNRALLDWLAGECHAAGGIRIEHLAHYIVTGDEEGADVLRGLDNLDFALKMLLANGRNYRPFFLYSDSVHTIDALPNLIVTTNRLLRIAGDYTRAEITSDPETIQHYRYHIQQLKTLCRPLIRFQFNPMEMMQDYSRVNTGVACQTLMRHPCTGQYITNEMIEDAVYKDLPNRKAICDMAAQYFSGLAASTSKNTSYFTKAGVRDFLDTGVVSDIPREIYRPLKIEHRREILARLIDDIQHHRATALLIDEDILPIPPNLTIGTSEYPVGVFFSNQDAVQNTPYFGIIVRERKIAQALYEFMTSLPQSHFVRDQAETLEFLQQCLADSAAE